MLSPLIAHSLNMCYHKIVLYSIHYICSIILKGHMCFTKTHLCLNINRPLSLYEYRPLFSLQHEHDILVETFNKLLTDNGEIRFRQLWIFKTFERSIC